MESPFSVRKSLTRPDYFYGRHAEAKRIFQHINKDAPENVSITGQRRVGKSWLLEYLYSTKEDHLKDRSDQISIIYWNLENQTPKTPKDFLKQMAEQIKQGLPDKFKTLFEFEEEEDDYDELSETLSDSIEILKEEKQHIVLMLDEFELITNKEAFEKSFFDQLRAWGQESLAYITATRKPLKELCHSDSITSSPFFNIFSKRTLRLLESEDVKLIFEKIFRKRSITFEKGALSEITNLTGGHPCLMSTLGNTLWLDLEDGQRIRDEDIRNLARDLDDQVRSDLQSYWEYLNDPERDAVKLIRKGKKITPQMTNALKDSALIRPSGTKNQFQLFSTLFSKICDEYEDGSATIERLFFDTPNFDANIVTMLKTILKSFPPDWAQDIQRVLEALERGNYVTACYECRYINDRLLEVLSKEVCGRSYNSDLHEDTRLLHELKDEAESKEISHLKVLVDQIWYIKNMSNYGAHRSPYGGLSVYDAVTTIMTSMSAVDKLIKNGYFELDETN